MKMKACLPVEMIMKCQANMKGVARTCHKEGVRHLYISTFSFKLKLTRPSPSESHPPVPSGWKSNAVCAED